MPLESKYSAVDVYRRAGGNFQTVTWTKVSTSTDSAFIQPISGNETFENGKGGERVTNRMYAPLTNTDVKYGDKVTQNSESYIVLWQNQVTGISGQSHHREILLGLFE